MPYKVKKRRKFYEISYDQYEQIKYDATLAYHIGDSDNPYPESSDAWEAWERGIDWCRRLDDY